MGRWPPDSAGRLKASALELFAERGFAAVTGAEIARRAGVSERTFFRRFKAKEDALFEDYSGVGATLTAAIVEAPEGMRARDLMQRVANALSDRFGAERDQHRVLSSVVKREPALRAREWLRDEVWARAIAEGFERRHYSRVSAALLASTTATTFRIVHDEWLDDQSQRTLATRFTEALAKLAAELD